MAVRDNISQSGGEVTVISDSKTSVMNMYLYQKGRERVNDLGFTSVHDGKLYAYATGTISSTQGSNTLYLDILINGVSINKKSVASTTSGAIIDCRVEDYDIKAGDIIEIKSKTVAGESAWSQGGSIVGYNFVVERSKL